MSADIGETEDVVISLSSRHWTTHSLSRFIERYGEFDIALKDFLSFVPRIDYRCRNLSQVMAGSSRAQSLVLVSVISYSEKEQRMIKVRLIYNHRDRVVVTALPAKLEPKKRRLVHLIV